MGIFDKKKNYVTGANMASYATPKTEYKGSLPKGTVRSGQKGSDVTAVQTFLNWGIGAGLVVDAICGPKTVKAIKAFQTQSKITADGIFGPNTKQKAQALINKYKPTPTPPKKKYKVIDISEFQSSINWTKAKADGVQGAIIRCGLRGAGSGKLSMDAMFLNHIKGAYKAGIPVGIYMFTEAINAKEGREEADYAIKLWQTEGVPISFPIGVDSENVFYYEGGRRIAGRANDKVLSRAKRTEAIKAFCERIKEKGYTPMIYASTSWLYNQLDMSKLPYDVWVAQYNSTCEYKGEYVIWQYTSSGRVAGASGNIDMNHCYIAPKAVNPPKDTPSKDDYNAEVGEKICAWCKKIADSKDYSYKVWTDDAETHKCPICNKQTGKYKGWNCIGFSWASWRHGGGLSNKCNCGIIDDGRGNKMIKMTVTEATKLVQERSGLKDIKVIINKNGIPASDLRKGDIILYYDGNEYTHSLVYVGDSKVSDCGRGNNPNIKYGKKYSQKECKIAIRYIGKTPTTKKGYTGAFPSYKLVKTNAQVIADAVKWAKWIAGDNRFHYGYGEHSHHNGCFFCGTQHLKRGHGIKNFEYTYCCNPFVGAAWAHGGGDAQAYKMCHSTNSWDFGTGAGSYHTSKLFEKVSLNSLKAGDVLCSDSHVALYVGNGKVAQAGHQDDNKVNSSKWNSSISVSTWGGYKRAYRYKGSVNTYRPLSHGEVSDRVADLQRFLVWYGCKITVDGIFGDGTLEAVKKFQKEQKLIVDGSVGEKTIKAMKAVEK